MDFYPPRRLGYSLGILILLSALALSAFSFLQLGAGEMTPWLTIWTLIPLLGLPLSALAAYRLYGLATASYRLDREAFSLSWGLSSERIPLNDLEPPIRVETLPHALRPPLSLWWPGCVVGNRQLPDLGAVEYFATRHDNQLLLIAAGEKLLAISPADREGFLRYYAAMVQMGSLERVRAHSSRPDFLPGRVWESPAARWLLSGGLALPLGLLGFLSIVAPQLAPQIPFGFAVDGSPGPLAPAARYLIFPLLGAAFWLINAVLGIWIFGRQDERLLAYWVWAIAILANLLLWGAVLQMLPRL